MPEKCLSCPVFSAFALAAEYEEGNGASLTDTMVDSIEGGPFSSSEANILWGKLHSELLDMTTGDEVHSLRSVARLAEQGDRCPAPKRGAISGESLASSVIAWLKNNKVCRNPGLEKLT